jgi:hypothetical protein
MAILQNAGDGVKKASAAETGSQKDKKKEAAERFRQRKLERAKESQKNGLALRDELVKAGLFDKLSADVKNFVIGLTKDPSEKAATASGSPVFNTLFGSSPKVGDKITLGEAFTRTYKGKSTLDVWVKRWAEKGIIVEFEVNKAKMLDSTYTIRSLT